MEECFMFQVLLNFEKSEDLDVVAHLFSLEILVSEVIYLIKDKNRIQKS